MEHGSTITGAYYAKLIREVCSTLNEMRRGKLVRDMLFLQETTRQHTLHLE